MSETVTFLLTSPIVMAVVIGASSAWWYWQLRKARCELRREREKLAANEAR